MEENKKPTLEQDALAGNASIKVVSAEKEARSLSYIEHNSELSHQPASARPHVEAKSRRQAPHIANDHSKAMKKLYMDLLAGFFIATVLTIIMVLICSILFSWPFIAPWLQASKSDLYDVVLAQIFSVAKKSLFMEYSFLIVPQAFLAFWFYKITNTMSERFQQSPPFSAGAIAAMSLISLVAIPNLSGGIDSTMFDPFYWIFVLLQCVICWRTSTFLSRQEITEEGKPSWEAPFFLCLGANVFLLFGLFLPGILDMTVLLLSQFWLIGFLIFVLALPQSNRTTKQVVKVRKNVEYENGQVVIRYPAIVWLEQWLRRRASQSNKPTSLLKLTILWFAIPFFCATQNPATSAIWSNALDAVSRFYQPAHSTPVADDRVVDYKYNSIAYTPKGAERNKDLSEIPGTSSYPANADIYGTQTNINIITCILLGGLFALGSASIYILSKPSHIVLSKDGFTFLKRHGSVKSTAASVKASTKNTRWNDIVEIDVHSSDRTSPVNDVLRFHCKSRAPIIISLKSIDTVEAREALLKAIVSFAPLIPRSANVIESLQPPASHSYTELWMQALSSAPKRERLKPLQKETFLQDGRLEILNQLGVGGQGLAYLAWDNETKQNVVLKEFLLPVYVEVDVRKKALEQFENEACILQKLDHDQIVKLVSFFVEDHRAYLVLEHIEGSSLRQLVQKDGALAEDRVKDLAIQMCTVLRYLHKLTPPVVHRDFTPDNLILQNDNLLKLIDFNVAKQSDTATGTVVGKHAYLPPEQFRGQAVTQSDIYGMGATLFYLLTGNDPEALSESHPKQIIPTLSDHLNGIVSRATAIDLQKRYQTADEILNDLTQSVI